MKDIIVDIRVGCVAVYKGPKQNCLDGISLRADTYYYRGGKWDEKIGAWVIKKRHVWAAKIIAAAINWGDDE